MKFYTCGYKTKEIISMFSYDLSASFSNNFLIMKLLILISVYTHTYNNF